MLATRAAAAAALCAVAGAKVIRGWNSWDSMMSSPWVGPSGGNSNETHTAVVAAYMSSTLLPYGFDLLTVDEGWYWVNDTDDGSSIDAYGRPYPRVDQYPSAAGGAGFAPLAAQLKAQGLRMGVWTVRGIPKAAVDRKLPIWGSAFTADQAVRSDRPCSWNRYCSGCAPADPTGATPGCNAAAVAYYRSVAALYKSWGLSYVKIDCMWPGDPNFIPDAGLGAYNDDVLSFTSAFAEVGIDVSLSPGNFVSPQNISYLSAHGLAVASRVTQDNWDIWADPYGVHGYPTGLRSKLDDAAQFAPFFGVDDPAATLPDLDMLPIGKVENQTHGPLTPSHLTHDEQVLLMTLWTATGAPLIIGAWLPLDADDTWTLGLLTNDLVLRVHNESHARRPLQPVGVSRPPTTYAWTSVPNNATAAAPAAYVSLYNAQDGNATVSVRLLDVGLPANGRYCAADLWAGGARVGAPINGGGVFGVQLRPHLAGSYLLAQC